MKKILVLGAGRSSSACIAYLIQHGQAHDWQITVGDVAEGAARERIGHSANATAVSFNIEDTETSHKTIGEADVVVSLIPANLHAKVATLCLAEKKHLLTASYASDEMKRF
ncbi:MAG TPA: saccharopine dehydrogenase NADP-binding domain-containing protein, partial [Cyclobacteriaceae bacterium]|nr:saccharopine dehydrogenase NADP-binding domain-containing protein [Cyclobacteriaceae bacterium]